MAEVITAEEIRSRLVDTGLDERQAGEIAARNALPIEYGPTVPPTLAVLLRAVESKADIERIEKLMQLHERHEANEARKAFVQAMARFRAEPMDIQKTKYVDIAGGAKFWHAQLADVCRAVIPALSKFGLRHRWEVSQDKPPAGLITVSCVISHELGHAETTTLSGPPDDLGKKSPIQAIASTVTLFERYTLVAAVGLAARDMDNDPHSEGAKPSGDALARPEDYDRWRADTLALADEGVDRLDAHWLKTPADIRRWVVVNEPEFWNECKAIAKKKTKQLKETAK
jgi:ERF superfamily